MKNSVIHPALNLGISYGDSTGRSHAGYQFGQSKEHQPDVVVVIDSVVHHEHVHEIASSSPDIVESHDYGVSVSDISIGALTGIDGTAEGDECRNNLKVSSEDHWDLRITRRSPIHPSMLRRWDLSQ